MKRRQWYRELDGIAVVASSKQQNNSGDAGGAAVPPRPTDPKGIGAWLLVLFVSMGGSV